MLNFISKDENIFCFNVNVSIYLMRNVIIMYLRNQPTLQSIQSHSTLHSIQVKFSWSQIYKVNIYVSHPKLYKIIYSSFLMLSNSFSFWNDYSDRRKKNAILLDLLGGSQGDKVCFFFISLTKVFANELVVEWKLLSFSMVHQMWYLSNVWLTEKVSLLCFMVLLKCSLHSEQMNEWFRVTNHIEQESHLSEQIWFIMLKSFRVNKAFQERQLTLE